MELHTFDEFLNEEKNKDKKKPTVGHTRKRGYYKEDPPDKLMKQKERVWAMSIATTMESRAKKHKHQTDGMRDAMKIFRAWIDKNKKSK